MHLSQTTIAQILATSSAQIRRDLTGASFTLLCTVEEAIACRFASSDWSDQTLTPMATRIVDELGWKMVEHSARGQVVVRCTIPDADAAKARCECDRGDGFKPIQVTQA
jgi:hypothetical protein